MIELTRIINGSLSSVVTSAAISKARRDKRARRRIRRCENGMAAVDDDGRTGAHLYNFRPLFGSMCAEEVVPQLDLIWKHQHVPTPDPSLGWLAPPNDGDGDEQDVSHQGRVRRNPRS